VRHIFITCGSYHKKFSQFPSHKRIHGINIWRRSVKNIETSICITPDRKKLLIHASRKLSMPVSDILAALMRKTRAAYRTKSALLWRAVQYQKRTSAEKYLIWHVSLEPRCYEFGVSERLVFKVSVSLIYRVAIDLFLDTLMSEGLDARVTIDDVATSYLEAKYNVSFSENESEEYWLISWDRRLKRSDK